MECLDEEWERLEGAKYYKRLAEGIDKCSRIAFPVHFFNFEIFEVVFTWGAHCPHSLRNASEQNSDSRPRSITYLGKNLGCQIINKLEKHVDQLRIVIFLIFQYYLNFYIW